MNFYFESDVFGGICCTIYDGELMLHTVDVLRILELDLSEVLVPLDEIAAVNGDINAVFASVPVVRSYILKSKSDARHDLERWLNTVAVPIRDQVAKFTV